MNKEQFLAISLLHELKGYVDGKDTISGQNIYILLSCHYKATTVEVVSTVVGESDFFTDKSKFKPILHPLSDLTKHITHKGETFVSIIELAKIVIDFRDYNPLVQCDESFICINTENHLFGFNSKSLHFSLYKLNSIGLFEQIGCPCQLKLFLKLIEWHFDISGLIEKGEAIDVNTLRENPYK